MYRIRQFLGSLEHYELRKLQQQIQKGKMDLAKEIQAKIKEHEKRHGQNCATCSNALDPLNTSNYTLLFGPEDFKKKASFCGLDCMEYFLDTLKMMRHATHAEESKEVKQ